MIRVKWVPVFSASTLLLTGSVHAGQDIFELDFDPILEIGSRGLDTSFLGLESTLHNDQAEDIVRYYSAIAIGQLNDDRSFTVLVEALDHENEHVVIGALTGLSELDDERTTAELGQYLRRASSSPLANAAVRGLAKQNTGPARQAMAEAAIDQSQHRDVRITVISYFKRSPDELSDHIFEELLGSGDVEIRARAAIGLSQRFSSKHDLALAGLLGDESLPPYVWSDIVRHFEKKARVDFDSTNNRSLGRAPTEKQAVQERIRNWAQSRTELPETPSQ